MVIDKYKYKEQKGDSTREDVYIGRGSTWGNPFVIGKDGSREEVIAKYRLYLYAQIVSGKITLQQLADLQNKDLICFCHPYPCHGDILVRASIWAAESIRPAECFVFGSNLAGRHGKGAAKYAHQHHGAKYGVGEGYMFSTGDEVEGYRCCYAIPTKDERIQTLSLDRIGGYVSTFLLYAQNNPNSIYKVTPIGCGLAGYTPEQIAPFFERVLTECMVYIHLPDEFLAVLS